MINDNILNIKLNNENINLKENIKEKVKNNNFNLGIDCKLVLKKLLIIYVNYIMIIMKVK